MLCNPALWLDIWSQNGLSVSSNHSVWQYARRIAAWFFSISNVFNAADICLPSRSIVRVQYYCTVHFTIACRGRTLAFLRGIFSNDSTTEIRILASIFVPKGTGKDTFVLCVYCLSIVLLEIYLWRWERLHCDTDVSTENTTCGHICRINNILSTRRFSNALLVTKDKESFCPGKEHADVVGYHLLVKM